MIKRFGLAIAALAIAASAALAQTSGVPSTTFLTNRGDQVFPFIAPPRGGATPGTIFNSVVYPPQGAPAAKTTSGLLTGADIATGIITVLQGAGAASAQQLPVGSDMSTAFPRVPIGGSVDFSVINISTTAAESASLTTNTGWSIVGNMDVAANNAATTKSAGSFRARKTGAATWVIYRLS